MSYSVHRRMVADVTVPLEHRASPARSCALHVANKLSVKRGVILEHVKQQTGVDLDMPGSNEALAIAFASIEALRSGARKAHPLRSLRIGSVPACRGHIGRRASGSQPPCDLVAANRASRAPPADLGRLRPPAEPPCLQDHLALQQQCPLRRKNSSRLIGGSISAPSSTASVPMPSVRPLRQPCARARCGGRGAGRSAPPAAAFWRLLPRSRPVLRFAASS